MPKSTTSESTPEAPSTPGKHDFSGKFADRFDAILKLFQNGWREQARKETATLSQYHLGERQRMARLAEAVGYDLDNPNDFAKPYTSHESHTIVNQAGGFLKGAMTALACAGIGGASVFGLSKFVSKSETPAPVETVIDKTKDLGVEYEAELIPPKDEP